MEELNRIIEEREFERERKSPLFTKEEINLIEERIKTLSKVGTRERVIGEGRIAFGVDLLKFFGDLESSNADTEYSRADFEFVLSQFYRLFEWGYYINEGMAEILKRSIQDFSKILDLRHIVIHSGRHFIPNESEYLNKKYSDFNAKSESLMVSTIHSKYNTIYIKVDRYTQHKVRGSVVEEKIVSSREFKIKIRRIASVAITFIDNIISNELMENRFKIESLREHRESLIKYNKIKLEESGVYIDFKGVKSLIFSKKVRYMQNDVTVHNSRLENFILLLEDIYNMTQIALPREDSTWVKNKIIWEIAEAAEDIYTHLIKSDNAKSEVWSAMDNYLLRITRNSDEVVLLHRIIDSRGTLLKESSDYVFKKRVNWVFDESKDYQVINHDYSILIASIIKQKELEITNPPGVINRYWGDWSKVYLDEKEISK